MAAGIGTAWLIQVEDDGNPGTYLTIGLQRGGDINFTLDEADITTKSSANWHEGIPSIRNWSMSGEGVVDQANTVQDELEEMFINRVQKNVRLLTANGVTYTGKATLTDFSRSIPHDGEVTLSFTLQGSGALTKV